MSRLFLSYRRKDSPDTVRLIYEKLKARLPRWEIFYDHLKIPPGQPFPERLHREVSNATVVLAIIGPRWLELLRERLDETVDYHREELRLALELGRTLVPVPVLNASLPAEKDLASFPDLLATPSLNALPIRPDPEFDRDIERLIAFLEPLGPSIDVGTVLAGKYKLTRLIGEGGMGVVYQADQLQPKRTVAVKLIKPGMDSKEVLARFDAERQALAVMDHRHSCKVFDAGLTPNGRPFFVMDFVKGVPITEFCDDKKLTPAERLNLFCDESAIFEYKEAIRLDPRYALPHNNLGRLLYNSGDLNGAVRELKEAIRLDQNLAVAHNNLGDALRRMKEFDGAIAAFNKAIDLKPDYAAPHNGLGDVLKNKNNLDGAIVEYKVAIRLDPKDATYHNSLGNALRDKRDLDGAIVSFKEAIRLRPRYAPAHNGFGNALLDKQNLDGAIAAFRIAILFDPKDAVFHHNLGVALGLKKDLDGAIAAFAAAVRIDPDNSMRHFTLGRFLYDKEDLSGAISEFKEAVRLDSKDAALHNGLGNALSKNKDLDGAIATFREAVRLDPSFLVAYYNLGNALREKKDLDGAIAANKEAIRLDPKSGIGQALLGRALRDNGRFREAKELFVEAQRLFPSSSPVQQSLMTDLATIDELLATERKLAEVLKKQTKLENTSEAIRFADLCGRYQQRYMLAVRFYTEAFQGDAQLEANFSIGHRYDAACYGVLAANGKGIDPPPAPERPELRRKARDWLAADLGAWTKLFETAQDKNRALVHEKMVHWLADPDLAGIRDPESLKLLQAVERTALEKLWKDVRALRDRTAPLQLAPMPRMRVEP